MSSGMSADEALARQLQGEENAAAAAAAAAARHHLRGGHDGQARLAQLVSDSASKARAYEDDLTQAIALSVMPLEELAAAAREASDLSRRLGEEPPLAEADALATELVRWFKQDFFSWVNSPPCGACGAAATRHTGMSPPTAEETQGGAARTELHACSQCGATTRFPRYNHPAKLLETRRGRCGEWANCFTLCCRAAGLEARLAVDVGDHVWAEYYSEAGRRWVHLDPCEAACDKPLLYEAGWGKRLSYVLAVGRHGAADVTRRYTRQWEAVAQRRGLATEPWLESLLRQATARCLAALPPEERQQAEARAAAERRELAAGGSGALSAEELALPGRTTGDAGWLAGRGEDGSALAAQKAQGAAAVPPPGTRYALARDEGLRAAQPRRLCGGAVRASSDNPPGETAARAFDGSPFTKWLDFGGPQGQRWLEYRLPAEQPAAALHQYALTAADDAPERDPRHVMLEAWSEERGAWVLLDERTQLSFPQRHARLVFSIGGGGAAAPVAAAASRRFRLRVVSVADPRSANSVQLAGLDLYAQPAAAPPTEQQEEQQERRQQQGEEQQQQGEEQPPPHQQQGSEPVAAGAVAANSSSGEGTGLENPFALLFGGLPPAAAPGGPA